MHPSRASSPPLDTVLHTPGIVATCNTTWGYLDSAEAIQKDKRVFDYEVGYLLPNKNVIADHADLLITLARPAAHSPVLSRNGSCSLRTNCA